jgi:hypothetical protein
MNFLTHNILRFYFSYSSVEAACDSAVFVVLLALGAAAAPPRLRALLSAGAATGLVPLPFDDVLTGTSVESKTVT